MLCEKRKALALVVLSPLLPSGLGPHMGKLWTWLSGDTLGMFAPCTDAVYVDSLDQVLVCTCK